MSKTTNTHSGSDALAQYQERIKLLERVLEAARQVTDWYNDNVPCISNLEEAIRACDVAKEQSGAD